jgi:hypothetical protein
VRDARVRATHRLHERSNNFRLDAVRQVAGIGNIGKAAPPIRDLLVLGEDVQGQRERPQVRLEHFRQCLRGCLAHLGAWALQQIERRFDGEQFAADLEPQHRNGFVEKPVPRGMRGHRLFVKELLDSIFQLVGLLLADVFQPWPIVPQRGVLHGGFKQTILNAIEFEYEEQQMRRCRRETILYVGVEFAARGVDRVARMDEPRIGDQTPHQVIERLIGFHRLRQRASGLRLAGQFRELAFVCLCEGETLRISAVQILLYLRVVHAGIQVGQIPFRQLADPAC